MKKLISKNGLLDVVANGVFTDDSGIRRKITNYDYSLVNTMYFTLEKYAELEWNIKTDFDIESDISNLCEIYNTLSDEDLYDNCSDFIADSVSEILDVIKIKIENMLGIFMECVNVCA